MTNPKRVPAAHAGQTPTAPTMDNVDFFLDVMPIIDNDIIAPPINETEINDKSWSG